MSAEKKTYLYVNTAPQSFTRKEDGTQFWTVLVGIAKATLSAKTGKTEAELQNLKVEMQIFPDKVEAVTEAFLAAKASGIKLAVKCDEFTLTELKPNNYITKTGVVVNGLKASCWANGGVLTTVGSSLTISEELRKLIEEYNKDNDDGGDLIS